MRSKSLHRRQFLALSARLAGASLLVGCSLDSAPSAPVAAPTDAPTDAPQPSAAPQPPTPDIAASLPHAPLEPGVWLRIDPDETITVWAAKSEMGQGISTALAMLVAEELDADWASIRVEQAGTDAKYGNQTTGGSTSMVESFMPLRTAGAAARAMLLAAAAQVWKIDVASLRTAPGAVVEPTSGRRLSYGALAGTAAQLEPPPISAIRLKQPHAYRIIGTRAPRLDTPAKLDGSAVFGLDVRRPGMLYAVVARCPVFGGTLASFDGAAAMALPGVLHVIEIASGVAVVAETTWAAMQGRAALAISWDEGANASLDSAQLGQQMAQSAEQRAAQEPSRQENLAQLVEATYELPHQAHATMEPMNCTADVRSDSAEIWAPTQDPQGAKMAAVVETGLPSDAVLVHTTLMGGGFGRRGKSDFVVEAVQISKALGAPVQVVWSREDDMQHDFYRPRSHHRLSAGLDADGRPLGWRHTVAAESIGYNIARGAELPYAIPSREPSSAVVTSGVPVGAWRSVAFSYNIFAIESFVDELAAAGGVDPYQLRRQQLGRNPNLLAVLDLAASKAGWGEPLPTGRGRGIAACSYDRTLVAQVAEASVAPDGVVKVHRVVCAIDCGQAINPAIVEAQVEGAIVYGLTAALKGEITIARGRVVQRNFDGYPLLRIDEMPTIEVHIVPSTATPRGVGEMAVPPIAAAVANAIFSATGKRIRRLPIRAEDLRA